MHPRGRHGVGGDGNYRPIKRGSDDRGLVSLPDLGVRRPFRVVLPRTPHAKGVSTQAPEGPGRQSSDSRSLTLLDPSRIGDTGLESDGRPREKSVGPFHGTEADHLNRNVSRCRDTDLHGSGRLCHRNPTAKRPVFAETGRRGNRFKDKTQVLLTPSSVHLPLVLLLFEMVHNPVTSPLTPPSRRDIRPAE